MIKHRWLGLLLAMILLGTIAGSAFAQSYSFTVNRMEVNLYANGDGTASIDYVYEFTNNPGAHVIDFVDIGMPNSNYDLAGITADINGSRITDIQKSEYVKPGIALGLGSSSIQPGEKGTVHASIKTVQKFFFPGTQKETEAYASFQFSPNWFGSEFVTGTTNATITIHMPPGLKPEEPRWFTPENWGGSPEPESGTDEEGRVFYRWQYPYVSSSAKSVFGGAFPARLIPAGAISSPPIQIDWEGILQQFCCWGFGLGMVGWFGFSIYMAIWGNKKRKLQYLPPKMSVEGHGIKRGLTAIEAAIVMEQPMDKVMTMVLFSVIKKGAAAVSRRDPLELKFTEPAPAGLQPYEIDFLAAFKEPNPATRKKNLQTMTVGLIKSAAEKMKGFSRKETVAYYESIMKNAWQQVETAQTPEVKSQMFDQYMDWTMLDRQFDDHSREVFRSGPVYVPMWWGHYDPTFHTPSAPSMGSIGSSVSGGGISLPHLPGSDFAASMVNGMQSFSAGVIGDITGFTSGVTQVTNPIPKSSSSGGSHSGGGCACACACAGCACACAGGGR